MLSTFMILRYFVVRYVIVLVLLVFLGPGKVLAQAAGQWKDARQINDRVCAYCHGTNVAPNILGRGINEDLVSEIVQAGSGAMPAFRPTDFSPSELAALAKFIHESKADDAKVDGR